MENNKTNLKNISTLNLKQKLQLSITNQLF